MKRFVSIIAAIAMLVSMLAMPAAAEDAAVNSVILGPINASNGTVTDIEAGAAASVSARKFAMAANPNGDTKIVMNFSETELNSFTGYDSNDRIHASFWYLATKAGVSNVSFMLSDYGLSLTDTLSLNSVPVNKWTKIDLFMQPQWTYVYNDGTADNTVVLNRIVDVMGIKEAVGNGFWQALLGDSYDSSKTYTLGSVSIGKFEAYIDGEIALSKSSRNLGSDGYYSSVATNRLAFGIDKNVDKEFYLQNAKVDVVNDFDVSTFDFGMAEVEDGSDYVTSGTTLAVRNGAAVSGITAEGYSVNAYTYDAGTYTPVSSDTALSAGNTVVVQKLNSENLEMIYYSVSEGKLYEYSNGNLTLANSTAAAGAGIGGKASDDTSGAASAKADVFFDATGVDGSEPKFIYTFDGYKVITVNMYVSDNSKGGTFRLTGQYGTVYTSDIAVSNLIPNQWNKVDFVLKMEAKYGADYTGAEPASLSAHLYNGTSSTYVNGTAVATGKNHAFGGWVKAGGSDPVRHGYTLRMGYNSLPEGVSAYIDDYSSYYTYFEPVLDKAPVISGEAVINGKIYAEFGAALSDVMSGINAEEGYSVKAFSISGDTYTEVTDSSEVAIGKTVVVINPANRISYYEIKNADDALNYTYSQNFDGSPALIIGNASRVETAGLAGKSADDTAIGLGLGYLAGAGGVTADETSISGYVDKNGNPVTSDNILVDEAGNKKPTTNGDRFLAIDSLDGMGKFADIRDLKGYKVVSANIMYTGTATDETFRISTNNSGAVSGNIPLSRLQPNQWNRVDFVIEMQGSKNPPAEKSETEIIEIENGICTTYINGRKAAESISCYGAYIWHFSLANYSSCSAFRLGFEVNSESDVVGYIDDYTSYFTPFAPDMSVFDTAPETVTAELGDALPAGDGVAVYTDTTYTNAASGTIASGNVIVKETVADSANGIKRYGYCVLRPVAVTETETGISVSANTEGILVIAEYNDEGLVKAVMHDTAEGAVDYVPEGTNAVKVMLIKDKLSLAPVCEYVRY